MNRRTLVPLVLGATLLYMPAQASAHTGIGDAASFGAGLLHPVAGPDHLLAMVAVGLWAAQMGGHALRVVPAAFIAAMLLGGVLGMSGIALPHVETGVLLSVLILGTLVAAALRMPVVASAAAAGLFAIFHGHAHGTEIPLAAGALAYSLGFALATVLLHGAGVAVGLAARLGRAEPVTRLAGAAIVASGIWLAAA